jgi:hypothetical protein
MRAVFPSTGGDCVDPAEDPVADVPPMDLADRAVDSVPRRLPDRVGDLGSVDVHLGRYAADIETRSAEDARLDDGYPQVVEVGSHDRVAGPGSDDRQIKMWHGATNQQQEAT